MSKLRRRVEMMECGCGAGIVGINIIGGVIIYPVETVHCETSEGLMRCEICGKINEKEN